MTISSVSLTQSQNARKVPVRRAPLKPISLLNLANDLRADAQLDAALQVPGTALLGRATDGVPLMIRLASPDVTHILISGPRADDNANLAATILASLALFQKPREIQFFVFTQAQAAFAFLDRLPHLYGTIQPDAEPSLRQLRWLETEMERRENERVTRPRLIVVAKEMHDWNKDAQREYRVRIARLAQRGRETGISLVLCQNEISRGDALRYENFPVRLSAHEHGLYDLLAGQERVRFQPARLLVEEYADWYAQMQQNLNPRVKPTTPSFGEMVGRFKRAWSKEDETA